MIYNFYVYFNTTIKKIIDESKNDLFIKDEK